MTTAFTDNENGETWVRDEITIEKEAKAVMEDVDKRQSPNETSIAGKHDTNPALSTYATAAILTAYTMTRTSALSVRSLTLLSARFGVGSWWQQSCFGSAVLAHVVL